jgi:hypothetical protein
MPKVLSRRVRRRLSTAKGNAGLATRHVSSRNTRLPPSGMAYRNEGLSPLLPHRPSPELGCLPSCGIYTQKDNKEEKSKRGTHVARRALHNERGG